MANEVEKALAPAGATVYAAVFNAAGEVFDWDDNTFKAITAPPTTPTLATREQPDSSGPDDSEYALADVGGLPTLDYSLINDGATPLQIWIKFFQQAGGSPDFAADEVLKICQGWIAFGSSFAEDPRIEIEFIGHNRPDIDQYDCAVTIKAHGEYLPQTSGSCSVSVWQLGTGAEHFLISTSAPAASGRFELTKAEPNFSTRAYFVTVTFNGKLYAKSFKAFG